jgi:diaminopimelate epimerase
VENETMACGTGTVATALCIAIEENKQSSVELYAPGGLLKVRFKNHNGVFTDISLNGEAKRVFTGIFAL